MTVAGSDAAETRHSKRAIAAGAVGNVIEWYDFTLYGYMAIIIAELFFPHGNHLVSLIAAYGVFAAGFLMRPLGGLVMGHLGDTVGRKYVLTVSVLLMTAPTLAIGLLPTYESWGIWASLTLAAIRMIQGFSVGGEFSGSVTFLAESAPAGRRGVATCWANVGGTVGMLLGAATPAMTIWILGQSETNAWGWRIPFLLAGVIGIVALLLRRGLPELTELTELEESVESREGKHPVVRLFRDEPKIAMRMTMIAAAYGVIFYIPIVYLPTWLSLHTSLELHEALFIASVGLFLQVPLILGLAWVSDRWVRRKHLVAMAFLAFGLLAVPLFLLADGGGPGLAIAVLLIFYAAISIMLATAPATFSEAFDRGHRLTGYSLTFSIGMSVCGGTAPMLATWMIHASGSAIAPAWYVAAWGAFGILVALNIRDRSREPLR